MRPPVGRDIGEAVADASHVEDEAVIRDRAQLLTETAGVRVHGARGTGRLETPYVAQELLLREDTRRLGGERREEGELLLGQTHQLAAHPHLAGEHVECERPRPPPAVAPRCRRAAQDGRDSGPQLRVAERLREVVVGTRLEAADG